MAGSSHEPPRSKGNRHLLDCQISSKREGRGGKRTAWAISCHAKAKANVRENPSCTNLPLGYVIHKHI